MQGPLTLNEEIERHYSKPGLAAVILAALADSGKDVTGKELAAIDEFHVRGRTATLELARAAGLKAGMQVLDVGSGLGGPSRCIAREFGCRVTGIDLTGEYCRVATMLAKRTELSHLVSYCHGDALNLPFPDGAFDAVWTQHVAMNIRDKKKFYQELHRVLKPGGTLALYDILAGAGGHVLFPVPWAHLPGTSFLSTPGQLRELLESSGFIISVWEDTTAVAQDWFTAVAGKTRKPDDLPQLGFHLILGSDFQSMVQNQRRNLEEGRIALAQVVAVK